jgi:hypothetical protein
VLLRVVVFALTLLGAAPLFPLLVGFTAELVFALAVLAAQFGVVFPLFLTLPRVPLPICRPALIIVLPVFPPAGVIAPPVSL